VPRDERVSACVRNNRFVRDREELSESNALHG